MDGPVVTMAKQALDTGDVKLILPYVPKDGEAEVIQAFEKVLPLHRQANGAKQVADQYFFETVVRIHRAGEGAPFTGLKPAGLEVGPIIPVAEKAIETESPDELEQLLVGIVRMEVRKRFDHMLHLKQHAHESVDAARAYVEAMLGLQVYSHQLYLCTKAAAHEEHHEHGH
jgi:hypothetical protein